MDNKETTQAPPTATLTKPDKKDPLSTPLDNAEPPFIVRGMAKKAGITYEEARKRFDDLPDPATQTTEEDSPKARTLSRRQLLLGLAGGVAAAGAAESQLRKPSWVTGILTGALNLIIQNRSKRLQAQSADTQTQPETKPDYPRLNHILELPLGSIERKSAEENYVREVKTLEQIDTGLNVVVDPELRIELLDKRYQIRLTGPEVVTGLRQPTDEELAWCNKPRKAGQDQKRIHPEDLMRCTDDFFLALKDLEDKEAEAEQLHPGQGKRKLLELYKQDLLEEEIKIVGGKKVGRLSKGEIETIRLRDFLPKPGGMVGIRFAESRASSPKTDLWYMGASIGKDPVEDFIHGETPQETTRLINLYNQFREALSAAGPLKYPARSIPGSKTADIGPNQIYVETLGTLFKYLHDNFKIAFNPVGMSTREAYLFLGRGSAWTDAKTGTRIVQKGYLIGDKLGGIDLEAEFRKPALSRQNSELVESNYSWALDYNQDIVATGVFDQKIVPFYREHYHVKAA